MNELLVTVFTALTTHQCEQLEDDIIRLLLSAGYVAQVESKSTGNTTTTDSMALRLQREAWDE